MSEQTANGYWLLEPDELADLMVNPRLRPLAEQVLGYLAGELMSRLNLAAHSVRVEVIEAQYLGPSYPCLGVQGENISDALATRIEQEVTRILLQTPLSAFLQNVTAA